MTEKGDNEDGMRRRREGGRWKEGNEGKDYEKKAFEGRGRNMEGD